MEQFVIAVTPMITPIKMCTNKAERNVRTQKNGKISVKMQTQIYAAQWTTVKFIKILQITRKLHADTIKKKKSATESDEIGGRKENKNANDRLKNDNNVGRDGNCDKKINWMK